MHLRLQQYKTLLGLTHKVPAALSDTKLIHLAITGLLGSNACLKEVFNNAHLLVVRFQSLV